MDRSLDEIAAEMDTRNLLGEPLYQRGRATSGSARRRYAPYDASASRSTWRKEASSSYESGPPERRRYASSVDKDRDCRVFVANLDFGVTWQRLKDFMRGGNLKY